MKVLVDGVAGEPAGRLLRLRLADDRQRRADRSSPRARQRALRLGRDRRRDPDRHPPGRARTTAGATGEAEASAPPGWRAPLRAAASGAAGRPRRRGSPATAPTPSTTTTGTPRSPAGLMSAPTTVPGGRVRAGTTRVYHFPTDFIGDAGRPQPAHRRPRPSHWRSTARGDSLPRWRPSCCSAAAT